MISIDRSTIVGLLAGMLLLAGVIAALLSDNSDNGIDLTNGSVTLEVTPSEPIKGSYGDK